MPETFLILLAGGVMLAIAVPSPKEVTLHWLRLGGIIALTMLGLSVFLWSRRDGGSGSWQAGLYVTSAVAILLQLAFTQVNKRALQRVFAIAAFVATVALADRLLPTPAKIPGLSYLEFGSLAAACGLVLMDMLLGHAYLTASKMTITPFKQINRGLAVSLAIRAVLSLGIATWLQARDPIYLFWGKFGLYVLTRWLVGLLVAGVFVYMAHDCIKRRSTQSATGILYVAGLMVFLGEIIALYLVSQTGLPF